MTYNSVTFFRSIFKTITWRVIASLDTMLISWYITNSFSIGASIAGIEVITKMVVYYFHERSWSHIKWGHIK